MLAEGCGLASSDGLKFAGVPLLIGLVVCMRTAQEWHPVENAFLDSLEREIDHRCDIQGNELGDDKAADDDQTKRAPR